MNLKPTTAITHLMCIFLIGVAFHVGAPVAEFKDIDFDCTSPWPASHLGLIKSNFNLR